MEIIDEWKMNIQIFKKEINENIFKFFSDKTIIHNNDFIKMLLYIQDTELYKKIKINYPLFSFIFLKNIINNDDLYDILSNIKNIDTFKTIDIVKFNLWKYCYNENINNFNYNNKIFESHVNNIIPIHKYIKYDKNMIIEMLIFTYYSKKDLLEHHEQSEKINDLISIYDFCKTNTYPLFKSSELTRLWSLKIQYLLKYKNEDPGHIWNKLNIFISPTEYGNSEDIIDIFFHILYKNIINGIVTKNILIWTYIFSYKIISNNMISKLFSVIYETPENMTGLFSDLYNDNRLDVIEKLKEDFMENDMEYIYKIYEKDIDINFYKSLNNDTLKILFEKEFIAKGEPFINSDLNINTFNSNLFNVFMKYDPFISQHSLNNLIKKTNDNNLQLNTLKESIIINNSLKLINSEHYMIKVTDPGTFIMKNVDINKLTNLDIFNKKIIKKYIYDIFLDKYYIIQDVEYFLDDYENFNVNKTKLFDFLMHITPLNNVDKVINIIKSDIKLYELFFN